MTKFTDLQTAIFSACVAEFNHNTAEEEKADHAYINNAKELAETTGRKVASIKGALGQMSKNGWITETDVNGEPGFHFTDEGIDAAFACATTDQPEEEPEAEYTAEQADKWEATYLEAMKAEGSSMSSALRAVAEGWTHGYKAHLAIAELHGVSRSTARRQWRKVRGAVYGPTAASA